MVDVVIIRLLPILLVPTTDASSLFNFPACQDCSSRVDVPCKIEKINDRCYHTEFRDKWPGKPRDLTSREIEIDDGRTSASFTWKPPYDASVDSLSGFFLTVNINIQLLTGMASLGPFCFHANLSGTDWRAIHNPHSVLFHFDCVTSTANKEIHVRLDVSSSPMPNRNAGYKESQVTIGRSSKLRMEDLKINYTVTGTTVYVVFGPLDKRVQYYNLCLSPCSSGFTQCFMQKNVSEEGSREAVFENVKPDNYTIMIQRNIEHTFFVSKCFSVVPPPVQDENSPLILLIIILGCLLFVVIATTVMFFCLRRYTRRFPSCIEKCKRNNQYEQTLQNIPNNTADTPEDDTKDLLFLFSTGHQSFITVAQKLANMVNQWTHFTVNINDTMCSNDEEVERRISQFTNQKVVILLTEGTKQLLLDTQNDSFPFLDNSPQNKFLYRIFSILLSRQKQGQCLVSLCSVTFISKVFEDLQTFFLVNSEKGIQNLSLDVKEFKDFINSLDPENNEIPDNLIEIESVEEFLTAVREYIKERKPVSVSYQRSNISYDVTSSNILPLCSESHFQAQNPMTERENDIKQWVESQQPPVQSYIDPNMTHNFQSVYQSPNLRFVNKHSHKRFRNPKRGQHTGMPYYQPKGYSYLEQAKKHCGISHTDNLHQNEEWEEPESDSESVTMSTILQQTMELNQDYMNVIEVGKLGIVCAAAGITIIDYVGMVRSVEGMSMQPALNPEHGRRKRDYVFANRYAARNYNFKRGEIVTFISPKDHEVTHVKRIIGLPGDYVRSKLDQKTQHLVPEGHCWVEGDNPHRSIDSNSYGPIPMGLIKEKVNFILWPWHRFGKVEMIEPSTFKVSRQRDPNINELKQWYRNRKET